MAEPLEWTISRRKFLGVTGGLLVAAACGGTKSTTTAPATERPTRRPTAGISIDGLPRQLIEIRGRVEPMTVFAVTDPTVLTGLLDPQSAAVEEVAEATAA